MTFIERAAQAYPLRHLFSNRRHDANSWLWHDSGSAARFFYSAKASKTDRAGSKHPTVKPIALMQYLIRLVTPKGGSLELLQELQRHTSGMRLARGTFRSEQQLDDPVGPVQACPIVTLLFFVHGDFPKYTMCIINFELGN